MQETLIRERIGRPLGSELYRMMKEDFDASPIIWTMRRYNSSLGADEAAARFEAFLQWVALVPSVPQDNWYVMLESPVEDAFHSFVLNTRQYDAFCEKFLGQFFHHDPMPDQVSPNVVYEAAAYTIGLLEDAYGPTLTPYLQDWRKQLTDGTFRVACVKCT